MPATKKRTSLRNAAKKSSDITDANIIQKVEDMPAAVEAGPSVTGSITVANKATAASKAAVVNKATGPSSLADSEQPGRSLLSGSEEPFLTSDSSPDQPKAEAQNQALSSPETVPEDQVLETPAAVKAADPKTEEVAQPAIPEPEPAPEEAAREQVIKPFEAINGNTPAPAVVVMDNNDESAEPADNNDVSMVNGHSTATSPETTNLRTRIEAVTIPEFDARAATPPRNVMGYEYSNIDEITMRQLREDIHAYTHDRSWCEESLLLDDITPAEARTYQLRILDLSHQIRHCLHRIETIEFKNRRTYAAPPRMPQYGSFNTAQRAVAGREQTNGYATPAHDNRGHLTNGTSAQAGTSNGQASAENGLKRPRSPGPRPSTADRSPENAHKRQKLMNQIPVDPIEFDQDADLEAVRAKGPIMAIQRLGFWKCHLCVTPKYLLAPVGKSPAAPTKWALKDISKMITHFCVMHEEQTVSDRLSELGAAFELNRGPLLYWLKTTKGARVNTDNGNIDGHGSIDDIIETLKAGRMPAALQRFSNSAKKMRLEPREV